MKTNSLKSILGACLMAGVLVFSISGCVEHRYYHQYHHHSPDYYNRRHMAPPPGVSVDIHN